MVILLVSSTNLTCLIKLIVIQIHFNLVVSTNTRSLVQTLASHAGYTVYQKKVHALSIYITNAHLFMAHWAVMSVRVLVKFKIIGYCPRLLISD